MQLGLDGLAVGVGGVGLGRRRRSGSGRNLFRLDGRNRSCLGSRARRRGRDRRHGFRRADERSPCAGGDGMRQDRARHLRRSMKLNVRFFMVLEEPAAVGRLRDFRDGSQHLSKRGTSARRGGLRRTRRYDRGRGRARHRELCSGGAGRGDLIIQMEELLRLCVRRRRDNGSGRRRHHRRAALHLLCPKRDKYLRIYVLHDAVHDLLCEPCLRSKRLHELVRILDAHEK